MFRLGFLSAIFAVLLPSRCRLVAVIDSLHSAIILQAISRYSAEPHNTILIMQLCVCIMNR